MRSTVLGFFCAAVLLPSFGCAVLRTEFMPSSSQPISIFDQSYVRTGTERVATGQAELRDSQGRLIATSTSYENRQYSWVERKWYPQQAGRRLDDESFFRIIHDEPAVIKYSDYHQAGLKRNKIGLILTGIGAPFLATGVGCTLGGVYGHDNVAAGVGYVTVILGAVLTGVGGTLAVTGKRAAAASDIRLFDEPDRFKAEALKYNQSLVGLRNRATPPPTAPTPTVSARRRPRR